MDMIEHQASGALEESALVLIEAQIEQPLPPEFQSLLNERQNFGSPFGAAVWRQHGIQHNGAVAMEADPVVWECRIRLGRFRRVLHAAQRHSSPRDGFRKRIKFSPRQCRRAV